MRYECVDGKENWNSHDDHLVESKVKEYEAHRRYFYFFSEEFSPEKKLVKVNVKRGDEHLHDSAVQVYNVWDEKVPKRR